MLGIRLPIEAEERLARHAAAIGRGKSVIAREWIMERLERESIDDEMRRAAQVIAANEIEDDRRWCDAMDRSFMEMLDEEDGGYDWGPDGPPA